MEHIGLSIHFCKVTLQILGTLWWSMLHNGSSEVLKYDRIYFQIVKMNQLKWCHYKFQTTIVTVNLNTEWSFWFFNYYYDHHYRGCGHGCGLIGLTNEFELPTRLWQILPASSMQEPCMSGLLAANFLQWRLQNCHGLNFPDEKLNSLYSKLSQKKN